MGGGITKKNKKKNNSPPPMPPPSPSPSPQGDIQQLLIVPDPAAAHSYCQLYMPACDQPLLYPLLAPFPEEVGTRPSSGGVPRELPSCRHPPMPTFFSAQSGPEPSAAPRRKGKKGKGKGKRKGKGKKRRNKELQEQHEAPEPPPETSQVVRVSSRTPNLV